VTQLTWSTLISKLTVGNPNVANKLVEANSISTSRFTKFVANLRKQGWSWINKHSNHHTNTRIDHHKLVTPTTRANIYADNLPLREDCRFFFSCYLFDLKHCGVLDDFVTKLKLFREAIRSLSGNCFRVAGHIFGYNPQL